MTEEQFPVAKDNSYVKIYRMQATGADGYTVRVSVPRAVVEKESRRLGLEIKEFTKEYRIQWLYNGFEGAWAKFVPKKKADDNKELDKEF